jgi:hypothetical protein
MTNSLRLRPQAALVLLLVSSSCHGPEADYLTFFSPQKTYQIDLSGDLTTPARAFLRHRTFLEVKRNGAILVPKQLLGSADMLDSGFNEKYPKSHWIDENALRLYGGHEGANAVDTLTVVNKTTTRVEFLSVVAIDRLFLLDIEPAAKHVINMSSQLSGSNVFLAIDGSGGKHPIQRVAWNFPPPPAGLGSNNLKPLQFTLILEPNGPSVTVEYPDGSRPAASGVIRERADGK